MRDRLARWLVGPFVRLSADGVYVVIRDGPVVVTFQPDHFRMKGSSRLERRTYPEEPLSTFIPPRRFASFVGTIR